MTNQSAATDPPILSLLAAAKAADEQISEIKAAFGAPGDWGYETREGRALFELLQFQAELRAAISQEAHIDAQFDALRAALG